MKKQVKSGLLLMLTGIFVVSVWVTGRYYWQLGQARRVNQQLQQLAQRPVSSTHPEQAVQIPIDFAALKAANPDIYAWITIEGTNVDYPILQNAEDTDFYLTHTADLAQGLPGSIFTHNTTAQDFSDPNTVVYGHNMRNQSMFGSLHWYEQSGFLREHPTATVYTENQILTYRLFAAEIFSSEVLTIQYDFTQTDERAAFLKDILAVKGAQLNEAESVTAADRFLTLVTCTHDSSEDYRFMVVGVLEHEET